MKVADEDAAAKEVKPPRRIRQLMRARRVRQARERRRARDRDAVRGEGRRAVEVADEDAAAEESGRHVGSGSSRGRGGRHRRGSGNARGRAARGRGARGRDRASDDAGRSARSRSRTEQGSSVGGGEVTEAGDVEEVGAREGAATRGRVVLALESEVGRLRDLARRLPIECWSHQTVYVFPITVDNRQTAFASSICISHHKILQREHANR